MLKKISPGSTIAVIAPAFPPDPQKTETGIKYLESKGYKVKRGKSLQGNYGYFSATDEQRTKEINENFTDSDVDAIFCARGGWGGLRLLDKLDYSIIEKNPKLLVGYSDITSLQLALWQKCRLPSLSGPMVSIDMATGLSDFTEKHFWGQIESPDNTYKIDLSQLEDIEIIKGGDCSGILLGGCLSLIAHQLGTPYSPDYTGTVLFFEDIGEKPYKIDRYLAQLKQAGILNKIAGLIVGEFVDCEEDGSFTIKDLVEQYTAEVDYPVIFNFPYGHNRQKISLPIGIGAKLDTNKNWIEFENPFI